MILDEEKVVDKVNDALEELTEMKQEAVRV